ncbi:putative carboxypeptidase D [Helianthus anomalus]
MPRIMGGYDPCLDDYAKSYYNKPEVQKALHVGDGLNLKNWSICNMDIFNGWAQSKDSVLPIYKKLIDAKFRIWVYRYVPLKRYLLPEIYMFYRI